MLPSLRLVIYFAVGALLWVAAAFSREFLVVAALYDVVLLFVALLDLALSPQPRHFEIQRIVADKMNLGAPNKIALEAHSRANASVALTLRDEPPLEWPIAASPPAATSPAAAPRSTSDLQTANLHANVARVQVKTEPGRTVRGDYQVTPTRRGQWRFGAISGRYPTRLGLWHRQFRRAPAAGQETVVRVFPDMSEVRRYELLLREGRLRELGLHTARLRGQGTEFESLRDYTSDDNFKDINWKASARRSKLIATQFEIERDQTIVIALDCGRMMTALAHLKAERGRWKAEEEALTPRSAFRVPPSETPLSKLDCAINATVLLSHVGASMGDAVGMLLFSDTVLGFVPPRKGRVQTGLIIEALYAAQPSLVEPDYIGAYNFLLARKLRRSLVVTFTDLIDPDASRELLQASGALRRHHNALCVTINNRDVMDLAEEMPQDASQLYAKAMAQRMLGQRASALESLRRQGVSVLDVEASQLTVAAVNRYLDLKARAAL